MPASATPFPPAAPSPRPARRITRGVTVIISAALVCAAATVLTAASADATTTGKYVSGHDAIGSVTSAKFVGSSLRVTGWAADPDARTSNASLLGIVDGRTHSGAAVTSLANAAVTKKYKLGRTPGFTMSIPIPAGKHTACVVVVNVGQGLRKILKCFAAPIGRTLTAAQIAARSPKGTFTSATATTHTIRLRGTAYDPDYVYRHEVIVAYVDRRSAATVHTGDHSAFDLTLPVSRGTHVACLWAVNIGWGHNTFLGCHAADTRGAAGSGKVTQSTLNKQVLAEAKKHIGQRYVWGATGPKTFDCSGLVMYSYHKFHYSTPRVSEDQFLAARLIPQSRAVPGDLVFYSDSEGDIYHVGIYSGPNMSVAAIDTQEGVNYQRIYPSGTTFFGSFTHN